MSCGAYRRLLSAYLDDALSGKQRTALLAHIEACPACAAMLARYRQMDLLLRRLPQSAPPDSLRQRVLCHLPARHHWLPARLPVMGGALAALCLALGLMFVGNRMERHFETLSAEQPVATPTVAGGLQRWNAPASGEVAAVEFVDASGSESGQVPRGDDAQMLQQVRRTVRRPDFHPLLPKYLPRGARLDDVDFGRNHPSGPIDRLEVGFATGGERLRLRQMIGRAAAIERQRTEAGLADRPHRVLVAGREWLYVHRPGAEPAGVLIGQRDDMTIWLESSLPEEELARVAASLGD